MTKAKQDYPRSLASDELICLPFLDTDTTADLPIADAELSLRGYPSWSVTLLRRIAAAGLWYQVFAWEWASLDAFDVLLGYVPMGLILGLLLALVGLYSAAVVVVTLSLTTLALAIISGVFRRRRRAGEDDKS